MKAIIQKYLILLPMIFIFGCDQDKKTSENVSNSNNKNLSDQLKEKDEIITSYIKSFNEIQDNLNEIKLKEKTISLRSQNIELQKSNKDQIISDINYIYNLLNKNRQSLTTMNKKFRVVTSENIELKRLNSNLSFQVTEKEKEITSLKNKLNILTNELNLLNISSANEEKVSEHKTNLLNRVYFAIGTYDGLKKGGLITDKGGVIGIGEISEINPDMDKEEFSVMDMNETKEISIAANEVKIITLHPTDSYKLMDTKLKIKKLVILDPREFWSVSKYLILMVSTEKPLPHKHYPNSNSKLNS